MRIILKSLFLKSKRWYLMCYYCSITVKTLSGYGTTVFSKSLFSLKNFFRNMVIPKLYFFMKNISQKSKFRWLQASDEISKICGELWAWKCWYGGIKKLCSSYDFCIINFHNIGNKGTKLFWECKNKGSCKATEIALGSWKLRNSQGSFQSKCFSSSTRA